MRLAAAFAAVALAVASLGPASAAPAIRADEWRAYKAAFVEPSGRVIDDANGGISHSEGQGYGMLLAFLAGQAADFEAIWSFTRSEMQLRDDGLVSWRWEADRTPHITDANNASDGDILIAYALGMAAEAWGRPDYRTAAERLAQAIGRGAVVAWSGRTILLPGAEGFDAATRPDGPVVNPSYWIFEALPVLADLDPQTDWAGLQVQGLRLLEKVQIGPRKLPPEWLSLQGPRAADGFPIEFGYNALRSPLYLLRAGFREATVLRRLHEGMTLPDGSVAIVDLATGRARDVLADPGYRAVAALVACALDGTVLPPDAAEFYPTNYYPSTLHLLVLSYARKDLPQCL